MRDALAEAKEEAFLTLKRFERESVEGLDLSEITFKKADFDKCIFSDCDFSETAFYECIFKVPVSTELLEGFRMDWQQRRRQRFSQKPF